MMWNDTGYTSSTQVPLYFQEVLIEVPTLPFPLSYFHNSFQFRFRNQASLYGNNDHWHIDYVKLDKNRSAADVNIHDIAFVYPFPTVLKNFTQLPADQFQDSTDLVSDIALRVHNLDSNAYNNPSATNFVKGADELYPTPINIANYTLETFNAYPDTVVHVAPSSEYAIRYFLTQFCDGLFNLFQFRDSVSTSDGNLIMSLFSSKHSSLLPSFVS